MAGEHLPGPPPTVLHAQVRCRDDALVRAAMDHESWPHVGRAAKEALVALYAAAAGMPEQDFAEQIAAIVRSDDVLASVVALIEQAAEPVDRGAVLAPPGRGPHVQMWKCPEPGCPLPSIPGGSTRPVAEPHCRLHPTQLLVRMP